VTHVASLERLLKFYLEGFPRFNVKRKEKLWLEGGRGEFPNRQYAGCPAACWRPDYMKRKAELDQQEPITDGLFIKPYIAVGASVAVTYIVRLRWSRGSVLAFGTQVREFTHTRPKPSDF
jgi:hypothetical protein